MPLSIDIDPNSVSAVKGGGYIVASKSTPGAFRLVWGNECSCPATGRRGRPQPSRTCQGQCWDLL
jgi:hypothetical protein